MREFLFRENTLAVSNLIPIIQNWLLIWTLVAEVNLKIVLMTPLENAVHGERDSKKSCLIS